MRNDPLAYRVSEFCRHYVLSKATFYREVAAKRLHTIKRGRTTLVLHTEAERWFANIHGELTQQV